MLDLTAEHLQLVERVVWRNFPRAWGEIREDLVGAGMVGLVEASRRFDPAVGVKFQSFAWPRILGAIRDYKRQTDHLSRQHRQMVLDGEVEDPGMPVMTGGWHDATDPDNQYGAFLDCDALRGALELLPVRDATIVRLYFIHDWSLRDIAALLGISLSRTEQLKARALLALRECLTPSWMDC